MLNKKSFKTIKALNNKKIKAKIRPTKWNKLTKTALL